MTTAAATSLQPLYPPKDWSKAGEALFATAVRGSRDDSQNAISQLVQTFRSWDMAVLAAFQQGAGRAQVEARIWAFNVKAARFQLEAGQAFALLYPEIVRHDVDGLAVRLPPDLSVVPYYLVKDGHRWRVARATSQPKKPLTLQPCSAAVTSFMGIMHFLAAQSVQRQGVR